MRLQVSEWCRDKPSATTPVLVCVPVGFHSPDERKRREHIMGIFPEPNTTHWDEDRAQRHRAHLDVGDVVCRAMTLLINDGLLPEDMDCGIAGDAVAQTIFDHGYDHLWQELAGLRRYIVTGDFELSEAAHFTAQRFSNSREELDDWAKLDEMRFDIMDDTLDADPDGKATEDQALILRDLLGNLPLELMFRYKAGQLKVGDVAVLYHFYDDAVCNHLGVFFNVGDDDA